MRTRIRIGVSAALFAAVVAVAGGALGGGTAGAVSDCWYVGHGSQSDICGHRTVVWEQTLINNDGHFHQYKHDVPWAADHHPWKWING